MIMKANWSCKDRLSVVRVNNSQMVKYEESMKWWLTPGRTVIACVIVEDGIKIIIFLNLLLANQMVEIRELQLH